MKVSSVKNRLECSRKDFLSNITDSTKSKNFYLSILARESIEKNESSMEFLKRNIQEGLFLLEKEEDNVLYNLKKKIDRYLEYVQHKVIISNGFESSVLVDGITIDVRVDMLLFHQDLNVLEAVKLKLSKPVLSYKGRKFENIPKNDVELYLMNKVLSSLSIEKIKISKDYNKKEITSILKNSIKTASFHHLTSKNDKSNEIIETYNFKKGDNIISCNEFSEEIQIKLSKVLKEEPRIDMFELNSCPGCQYEGMCSLSHEKEIILEELSEEKSKASSDFSLTADQQEAISFDEGIARINAGAGSGKTTITALRVVELLKKGINPKDILLITFTNKGAKEMQEKISYWLKRFDLETFKEEDFNIMTFNSWGDNTVKEYYKLLGFTKEPKLIERVDSYDIIINLLNRINPSFNTINYSNPVMNFRNAKGIVVELAQAFNSIKSNSIGSSDKFIKSKYVKDTFYDKSKDSLMLTDDKRKDLETIFNLYSSYKEELKVRNLIEYQDQINYVIELISNHLDKFNAQYEYIIIDEYQDTDFQQLKIAQYLSSQKDFRSLMVVGDDSQSIYGFRNTTQEIILNFPKYFNDVVDINMVNNFRSTNEILALANAVNNININKIDKELIGSNPGGDIPLNYQFSLGKDEIPFIANDIREKIVGGVKPQDIAFLSRTKNELNKMREELLLLGVPVIIDMPTPLIENPSFNMLMVLADYINNIRDSENFNLFQFLFSYQKGFRNLDKVAMKGFLKESGNMIRDEILEGSFSEINEEGEVVGDPIEEENIRKFKVFFMLSELIKDNEIQNLIVELKENQPNSFSELSSYLRKINLYKDTKFVEGDGREYKAVTLSTVHSSKGREWNSVYISLTNFFNKKDTDMEEERRLVFVGLTRAKENLTISSVEYMNKRAGIKNRYSEEIVGTGLTNNIYI